MNREVPILFNSAMASNLFVSQVLPEPNSGCWLWMGAFNEKGYGRFREVMAHRAALALVGRQIPAGMEVDHTCRVRCCVNPQHLDIVTHAENLRRKPVPATCPKGHARFSRSRDGSRICLECGRLANTTRYDRRRVGERRRYRWFTDETKAQIRALHQAGLSQRAIAKEIGCAQASVHRVIYA